VQRLSNRGGGIATFFLLKGVAAEEFLEVMNSKDPSHPHWSFPCVNLING